MYLSFLQQESARNLPDASNITKATSSATAAAAVTAVNDTAQLLDEVTRIGDSCSTILQLWIRLFIFFFYQYQFLKPVFFLLMDRDLKKEFCQLFSSEDENGIGENFKSHPANNLKMPL